MGGVWHRRLVTLYGWLCLDRCARLEWEKNLMWHAAGSGGATGGTLRLPPTLAMTGSELRFEFGPANRMCWPPWSVSVVIVHLSVALAALRVGLICFGWGKGRD